MLLHQIAAGAQLPANTKPAFMYSKIDAAKIGNEITIIPGNPCQFSKTTTGLSNIITDIGVSSGKHYWEFFSNNSSTVGIVNSSFGLNQGIEIGRDSNSIGWSSNGSIYVKNQLFMSGGNSRFTMSDILCFSLNLDIGYESESITLSRNGISVCTIRSPRMLTGLIYPCVSGTVGGWIGEFNFGMKPFSFTLPEGYD